MRAALELEVNKVLPIEDSRRKTWALYHVKTANEYTRRFDSPSTTYEYQRALKIDPSNSEARLSFANMLKLNELNELYLEQLRFVQQMSDDEKANSVEISDTIEAYDSLLKNTLSLITTGTLSDESTTDNGESKTSRSSIGYKGIRIQ